MSPARLAYQIWNSRRPLWPAATDEERFTAGYLAGRAAATAESDRRIPRECDCVDPYRCKAKLMEGAEYMGELA